MRFRITQAGFVFQVRVAMQVTAHSSRMLSREEVPALVLAPALRVALAIAIAIAVLVMPRAGARVGLALDRKKILNESQAPSEGGGLAAGNSAAAWRAARWRSHTASQAAVCCCVTRSVARLYHGNHDCSVARSYSREKTFKLARALLPEGQSSAPAPAWL